MRTEEISQAVPWVLWAAQERALELGPELPSDSSWNQKEVSLRVSGGIQFRILLGEDYSRCLHHRHLDALPLKEQQDAQTLGRMTGDSEAITLELGWVWEG